MRLADRLLIKWTFFLATQLVALGAGVRMFRAAVSAGSVGMRATAIALIACGSVGIILCGAGYLNALVGRKGGES